MKDILSSSELRQYDKEEVHVGIPNSINDLQLESDQVNWLNTITDWENEELKQLVSDLDLDRFLIKLMEDGYDNNKVIKLEDTLLLSVNTLNSVDSEIQYENIFFVLYKNFVWSIQEVQGDHFDWVRERIDQNLGIVRSQKGDYLLYLLLESISDNYMKLLEHYGQRLTSILPTENNLEPEISLELEEIRTELLQFKKFISGLRNIGVALEHNLPANFEGQYFTEIKEQAINMSAELEFELNQIDGKLNLVYSLQGHKMNQIMKTLTVVSAIFIPLSFLTGLYGMNFDYIPELKVKNGYFILLSIMGTSILGLLLYFYRKKWF